MKPEDEKKVWGAQGLVSSFYETRFHHMTKIDCSFVVPIALFVAIYPAFLDLIFLSLHTHLRHKYLSIRHNRHKKPLTSTKKPTTNIKPSLFSNTQNASLRPLSTHHHDPRYRQPRHTNPITVSFSSIRNHHSTLSTELVGQVLAQGEQRS